MIKLLGERLLVRKETVVEKTPGGLILTTVEEKEGGLGKGSVALTGEGLEEFKNKTVYYDKYSRVPIVFEGEQFFIIRKEDIAAVEDK